MKENFLHETCFQALTDTEPSEKVRYRTEVDIAVQLLSAHF